MKKYWRILALMLAVCMAAGIGLQASAGVALDPEHRCALTVTPAEFDELMNEREIAVDLYRVASVSQICEYTPLAGFESLDLSPKMEGDEKWESEANRAAERILAEDSTIAPDVTITIRNGMASATDLDTGVYVLIAHAPNAEKKDYAVRDEQTGHMYTTMDTDFYHYTILPLMVSLPGSADNLTSSDDWLYELSVVLKMERENRYGDLEIVKTLDTYSTLQGAVTFVFEVKAEFEGKTVYNNVHALIFDQPGQKAELIQHLPAGAEVTVTEVYSGASYKLITDPTKTATIIAEQVVSVDFTNTYDDRVRGGNGVINSFAHDGEKWNWTSQQDAN